MANESVATFSGRSIIWSRMKGDGTEAKNIGWGIATVTSSQNANVNLFGPATEARTAGTSSLVSTTQLADTYQVVGSITCAVAAKTITEVGLFDTTTLSTTTTLAASLTASATTATFGANPGPNSGGNYYVQVNNETILVTAANSTTLTISRGALGSTSAIQASGSVATIGGDGGAYANGGVGGSTYAVPASLGGSMFIHADFAGVALNAGDSISFTISDTLT
jgi:hypothetical protein